MTDRYSSGVPPLPYDQGRSGREVPDPQEPFVVGTCRCRVEGSRTEFEGTFHLTPPELRTHAMLVGATGCGKTTLIHHLIEQDVSNGHSFVVLDPRGDLCDAALAILASRGCDASKIAVLDLREKVRPAGFDPLRTLGEPYFAALGVMDAIESESESWGVQLAETLRHSLVLLSSVRCPLTRLEDVLYDDGFLRECLSLSAGGEARGFWTRYLALTPSRRDALALPVMNKVSLLLSTEALRKTLEHPAPLELAAHLDKPGSVLLVSLAVDELHRAGRMMGRIFLATLCREIFARVRLPERNRNPVRLYVDEFSHFGSQEFESILSEGRRFGLSLLLAHQTLSQLAPKIRSLVLGNVGVKVAFRCGRDDATTLEKDIPDFPDDLDLAKQATGRSLIWTRDGGCVNVKIKPPLDAIGEVGLKVGHRLCQAVLARPWPVPAEDASLGSREGAAGKRAHKPFVPNGAMEDWLS